MFFYHLWKVPSLVPSLWHAFMCCFIRSSTIFFCVVLFLFHPFYASFLSSFTTHFTNIGHFGDFPTLWFQYFSLQNVHVSNSNFLKQMIVQTVPQGMGGWPKPHFPSPRPLTKEKKEKKRKESHAKHTTNWKLVDHEYSLRRGNPTPKPMLWANSTLSINLNWKLVFLSFAREAWIL